MLHTIVSSLFLRRRQIEGSSYVSKWLPALCVMHISIYAIVPSIAGTILAPTQADYAAQIAPCTAGYSLVRRTRGSGTHPPWCGPPSTDSRTTAFNKAWCWLIVSGRLAS